MTTPESITASQIDGLLFEARHASDRTMAAICRVALGDSPTDAYESEEPGLEGQATLRGMTQETARAECARVIAAAEAMDD